jgi:macrocin-O-methyltransferase TylF-like protien
VNAQILALGRNIWIPKRLRRVEARLDGIEAQSKTIMAQLEAQSETIMAQLEAQSETIMAQSETLMAQSETLMAQSETRLEGIETQITDLSRALRKPRRAEPTDKRFLEAASLVLAQGRTKLQQDRLWILWQAARNTAHLGHAAAEVGTYRGGSAYFLALAFQMLLGHEIPLDAIDTFEGHPQGKVSAEDPPSHHQADAFAGTSYAEVIGYLREFEQVDVHKGELTAIAGDLPQRTYQLVHLDVDLYESTRDCLEYFTGRVARGGVIVLDDYDAPNCPGVRRAAEELLSTDDRWQWWQPQTEQLLLIKLA